MIFIDVAMKAASEAALQDLLPTIRAVMKETAQEQGCKTYRFTIDIDDPSIIRVTELWESEDALFGHFEGTAVRKIFEVMPQFTVLGMQAYQGDLQPYDVPRPPALQD